MFMALEWSPYYHFISPLHCGSIYWPSRWNLGLVELPSGAYPCKHSHTARALFILLWTSLLAIALSTWQLCTTILTQLSRTRYGVFFVTYIYNSITGSWLVFEDFNSILKQSGVGQLLGHACMGFLLSCRTAILWIWASRVHVLHGLIIRKNHFHIREKSFPKTKKIHLTNSTSDHSPILLDTDPTCMHKSSRFIYDNRWSVHNSYHELVKSIWNHDVDGSYAFKFMNKIKHIRKKSIGKIKIFRTILKN